MTRGGYWRSWVISGVLTMTEAKFVLIWAAEDLEWFPCWLEHSARSVPRTARQPPRKETDVHIEKETKACLLVRSLRPYLDLLATECTGLGVDFLYIIAYHTLKGRGTSWGSFQNADSNSVGVDSEFSAFLISSQLMPVLLCSDHTCSSTVPLNGTLKTCFTDCICVQRRLAIGNMCKTCALSTTKHCWRKLKTAERERLSILMNRKMQSIDSTWSQ